VGDGRAVRLVRHDPAQPIDTRPRWSYFLRADTTHSLYTYLEDHPNPGARSDSIS
jgi:hypothetical protein